MFLWLLKLASAILCRAHARIGRPICSRCAGVPFHSLKCLNASLLFIEGGGGESAEENLRKVLNKSFV
jgi:hypothetical protein